MTRYRASRPDAEQKVHFKLYKSGTIWVAMGIATVSLALFGGQVNASAETATTAATATSETTTISSSTETNSISGDSFVLSHGQSSSVDTATTQSADTEKTDDQVSTRDTTVVKTDPAEVQADSSQVEPVKTAESTKDTASEQVSTVTAVKAETTTKPETTSKSAKSETSEITPEALKTTNNTQTTQTIKSTAAQQSLKTAEAPTTVNPLKPQTLPTGTITWDQTGNPNGWLSKNSTIGGVQVDSDYNLKAILERSYYYTINDWTGQAKVNPNPVTFIKTAWEFGTPFTETFYRTASVDTAGKIVLSDWQTADGQLATTFKYPNVTSLPDIKGYKPAQWNQGSRADSPTDYPYELIDVKPFKLTDLNGWDVTKGETGITAHSDYVVTTYLPEKQKWTLTFIDSSTNQQLDQLSAVNPSEMPITPAFWSPTKSIQYFENEGYRFISSDYPTTTWYMDTDSNVTQNFNFYFTPRIDYGTATSTRTIHFTKQDGTTQLAPDEIQTMTYTTIKNAVSGNVIYVPTGVYNAFNSPIVAGYTPEIATVPMLGVGLLWTAPESTTVIVRYTPTTPGSGGGTVTPPVTPTTPTTPVTPVSPVTPATPITPVTPETPGTTPSTPETTVVIPPTTSKKQVPNSNKTPKSNKVTTVSDKNTVISRQKESNAVAHVKVVTTAQREMPANSKLTQTRPATQNLPQTNEANSSVITVMGMTVLTSLLGLFGLKLKRHYE
ncbi:KxYKxGKxW signal peptide domain-containing protein [Secundilactobacillus hailunensis]|uniref:KxYKxGKxW signal peptide domain-containing protein n=1 Tax=Secundilactobacillus hailunensis TaxID=2559923 RepID=A0ABW1T7K0_9LACO|nr:KxYKxGKxW signal peptide domain-containing protein [Secundilactobacillus hailunensis]